MVYFYINSSVYIPNKYLYFSYISISIEITFLSSFAVFLQVISVYTVLRVF
jgi:hypothetical protein